MALYRDNLPQLGGDLYLTDAGLETDLIFNHDIEIREFAAHTLLPDDATRDSMANYFRGFLQLAKDTDAGFIVDTQTWKAHRHWSSDLGESVEELEATNRASVEFIAALREEFAGNTKPIVLNAPIGPRGDAYAPEDLISAEDAEAYYVEQLGWLADTELDMVTALTFTQASEAIGLVRAALTTGFPAVVSFTVETDGRLPTGQPLGEAIDEVDSETGDAAAYFMVNCAHPEHFSAVLETDGWARRIRGLRCNASRKSHEELDNSETLDDGNPQELGHQVADMVRQLPWINVIGGCCGSDLRHVREIHRALQ